MSEIGEAFRALKEDRKKKKEANKQSSTELLTNAGISFESKNGGTHLIVNGGSIDFWPSTGLWIVRANGNRKRGVRKLIKYVMEQM